MVPMCLPKLPHVILQAASCSGSINCTLRKRRLVFFPSTMDNPPENTPDILQTSNPWQSRFVTAERAVIYPFKAEYLTASGPTQRKKVATTKILPALFEYWRKNDPQDPRIVNVADSTEVSLNSTCGIIISH